MWMELYNRICPQRHIHAGSGRFLFHRIPLLLVKHSRKKTRYRLFGFIPVVTCKRTRAHYKYKLFDFITICRMNFDQMLQKRYKSHISRIAHKSKIHIGFLVWQNTKWSYESLYNQFASNPRYDVTVLIINAKSARVSPQVNTQDNIAFFKNHNVKVINNIADYKNANIDIAFYEQPWFVIDNLDTDFHPHNLSLYSLTFYVPYAIQMDADNPNVVEACKSFYDTLYLSFMFNDLILSNFKAYNITNMIAVGHPKLDVYASPAKTDNAWRSADKLRVIYAPHHSFGNSFLKWATWEWNGQHLLELATKTQDSVEWIFKPHPRFLVALKELLGSAEKAQAVYDDWQKVATVCTSGDYFDIFKTADLMISDCGSFVLEWLPTGKPYMQLIPHYPDTSPRSETDRHYSSQYYKCNTNDDIDTIFDMLINQHQDPMKDSRIKLAQSIPMNATEKIYSYINNLTNNKE
ncbi:hypothetical protein HDR61_03255 [bacterium]|nr:hypothetical protein [bacterium]